MALAISIEIGKKSVFQYRVKQLKESLWKTTSNIEKNLKSQN